MELEIAPCSNAEEPHRLGYAHCLVSGCFRGGQLATYSRGNHHGCPILLHIHNMP